MSSPIKTDETPEQKLQRFLEASGIKQMREDLDSFQAQMAGIIKELGNTNQTLNQVTATLNQVVGIINQPVQQPQPTQIAQNPSPANVPQLGQALGQLDPVSKANLISNVSSGLAELVKAWRGTAIQSDAMGELGKQMLTDLVRATVDDIQQRVYGIRKIPPSNVLQDTSHRLA